MPIYLEQRDDYWVAEDDEGYGNALILRTSWNKRYMDVVDKHRVKTIRLNEYLGWRDSDVSFLIEIPGIHGVDILSDRVTDVSPVFELHKLKTISLFCKSKIAGDFMRLPHLESVGLGWRNVYKSVFRHNRLVSVNIQAYPGKDLTGWAANAVLTSLSLSSNRLEQLLGLERFPNITRLDLCWCRKLRSLDALAMSPSIRQLRIDHCAGISDLSPIAHLTELMQLKVEDCRDIASLSPIAGCRKLQFLQVAGNTTILDGDLAFLRRLPKLKKVLLTQREHYTHTDAELQRK